MRKLLTGIALFLPLSVLPELSITETHQIDLICYNTEKLFKELRSEYQELPFFFGETDDQIESTMSFWMRKGGESWTIIATKKDLSCVVSAGKNLKLIKSGKII